MNRETFHFFHSLVYCALAMVGAIATGPHWLPLWGAFALFSLGGALVHVLWEEAA